MAVHQRNYYKTRQKYASIVSRIAFALPPIETVKMRSLIILGLFSFNSFSQAAPQSGKVENILKGSLDLIPSPSPSVKIQIMGGKVCMR